MAEPTITAEDFEVWREHPVTRWVLDGLANIAARQEQVFKDAAWSGNLDPINHARCTALADANRDLSTITYQQALGANGEDE